MRAAVLMIGLGLLGCQKPAAPVKLSLPPPAPTAGCPHVPQPLAKAKPPKPPASDFPQLLEPAHWDWQGLEYVWVVPHWVILTAPHAPSWVAGTWRADHGACVWVPAHWSFPPVALQ